MQLDCKNVTYALKDGVLTHISDVESGLKCGCVCAGCKGELIAKKGEIKVHHFAHVNAECAHAYESMVHYICKNAFKHLTHFKTPRYAHGLTRKDYLMSIDPYVPAKTIDLSLFEIEIEYKYKDIVADVALLHEQKPMLFIEIANTHLIDDAKLAKIKEYGIACFEVYVAYMPIDFTLSQDLNNKLGLKIIRDYMESNSVWVYNRKLKKEYDLLILKRQWKRSTDMVWTRIKTANRILDMINENNVTREADFILRQNWTDWKTRQVL